MGVYFAKLMLNTINLCWEIYKLEFYWQQRYFICFKNSTSRNEQRHYKMILKNSTAMTT